VAHDDDLEPFPFPELLTAFHRYQTLIDLLLAHQGANGVCYVSRRTLAAELGISEALVARHLKVLASGEACIVPESGGYRVVHADLRQHGPIARVLRYIDAIYHDPDLFLLPQPVQAARLGLDRVDIQRAWAFLKVGVHNP